jgi:hypothetical protein
MGWCVVQVWCERLVDRPPPSTPVRVYSVLNGAVPVRLKRADWGWMALWGRAAALGSRRPIILQRYVTTAAGPIYLAGAALWACSGFPTRRMNSALGMYIP